MYQKLKIQDNNNLNFCIAHGIILGFMLYIT